MQREALDVIGQSQQDVVLSPSGSGEIIATFSSYEYRLFTEVGYVN